MGPSLRQKLKSSLCISGCFRKIHDNNHRVPSQPPSPSPSPSPSSVSPGEKSGHFDLTPSPRDRRHHHHHNHNKTKSPRLSRTLSKSQEKCRSLIHRIGSVGGAASSGGRGKHVRRHTTDFHYDALSYSLNFDKGDDDNLNQFPLRNFSSRLPNSPPPSSATAVTAAVAEEDETNSAAGGEIFAAHSVLR